MRGGGKSGEADGDDAKSGVGEARGGDTADADAGAIETGDAGTAGEVETGEAAGDDETGEAAGEGDAAPLPTTSG